MDARSEEGLKPVVKPNPFRKKHQYEGVITQMIEYCGGVGVEKQTSTRDICDALGLAYGVASDLRKVAERTGGMTTRYSGGPKGALGRRAHWTFLHDEKWIADQALAQWDVRLTAYDIEKKMPKDYRFNQSTRKAPHKPSDPPGINGVDPRPTIDDTTEFKNTGQKYVIKDETTDMEVKMRLAGASRKDEGEALIEAARQYAGREEFIKEELKRFAEMGITIDETAIKVEKDDRLEGVAVLLPYIDRLKRSIERQSKALDEVQETGKNAKRVEQLEQDLADRNDDIRKVRHAHEELKNQKRLKLQEKDREIQHLRAELEAQVTENLRLVAAKG